MKARPQGWRWKTAWVFALVLCVARSLDASAAGRLSEKVLFNIEPGVAALRLNEFGAQSEIQLVYNYEDMQDVCVAGVHGEYKPPEALQIMLKGTDITYLMMNRNTVTFRRKTSGVRTAKAVAMRQGNGKPKGDRRTIAGLEEVTISSGHESILESTGSPLVTMNRADIDSTGYVTVQGIIRTLPQIFGGGPTEDTSQGFEARTNTTRGTGMNLRGLGASATLVLMNGHRLAGGGSEGLFVDVSNLPLAAIERIDVLPDSSSTYYGADAAGGVANFVMRESFKGLQTEAYFGDSTRGGGFNENYVSQIVGARTDAGHGLFAVDFYSRDNLSAATREMARSDLREYGGSNYDVPLSNPGNIVLGNTSWAIPTGQDGTGLSASSFQRGSQNLQNQLKGADVLPSQQRWSTFGTWRQDISERVSAFGDTIFGRRTIHGNGSGQIALFQVPVSNAFYVNPTGVPGPVTMRYNFLDDLGPLLTEARVQSFDSTAGMELRLGSGWQVTVSGGYAAEHIHSTIENQVSASALAKALASNDRSVAFNPFGDGSYSNPETLDSMRAGTVVTYRSSLTSGALLVRGPLLTLPGGDLLLSFGGDAREQAFKSTNFSDSTPVPTDVKNDMGRSIHSGFAELQVPIFGPPNSRRGIESLSISLAERYERYSDFGRTVAARMGLAWVPVSGVTVRGTYSESFRPPGLLDLDEVNNAYGFTLLRDPQNGGPSSVMVLAGKNRDLREENARSWTAGLELAPQTLPGSAIAFTYFSTNFSDRLSRPALSADLLSNPTLSALVTRSPSPEFRAEVCARSPQTASAAAGSCLTTPIAAIVDLRVRNDSIVETRGFDMLARYARATALGRFSFSLNGTYILEFSEAQQANMPLTNRVSTPSYPVNLKLRSTARWERGGWEVSAYANYLNDYVDTTATPHKKIDSWTTIDLHASYTLDRSTHSTFGDTTFSLGIDNAMDADPPFVNNPVGLGYDQENGDLTGRMVSFSVRKKW